MDPKPIQLLLQQYWVYVIYISLICFVSDFFRGNSTANTLRMAELAFGFVWQQQLHRPFLCMLHKWVQNIFKVAFIYLNSGVPPDHCRGPSQIRPLTWWRAAAATIAAFYFAKAREDRSLAGLSLELVSKELNHLAAILHVYGGDLIFMK